MPSWQGRETLPTLAQLPKAPNSIRVRLRCLRLEMQSCFPCRSCSLSLNFLEIIKTHAVHIQNVSKHLKDLCPTYGYVRDLDFHRMLYTVLCSLVNGYILKNTSVWVLLLVHPWKQYICPMASIKRSLQYVGRDSWYTSLYIHNFYLISLTGIQYPAIAFKSYI